MGPGLQSPKAGFLKSLFGGIQVTEVPQQGCDGLRSGSYKRQVDVRRIVHIRIKDVGLHSGPTGPQIFSLPLSAGSPLGRP